MKKKLIAGFVGFMSSFLVFVPAGADTLKDRILIQVVLEVEAGFLSEYSEQERSRITESGFSLATVETRLEARLSDRVKGIAVFLYEAGEPFLVDEAFIHLGADDGCLNFRAGEFYVPFGNYETSLISDPLTLEMGETRETAVELNFWAAGLYVQAYLFNGDVDRADSDSHLENVGLSAGYALEKGVYSFEAGAGWISHVLDSDGLSAAAAQREALSAGVVYGLRAYVPGLDAHIALSAGPVSFCGEYMSMLVDPEWDLSDETPGSMTALGLGPLFSMKKHSVWSVETSVFFPFCRHETTVTLGAQGTKNAEDFLPKERYLAAVAVDLFQGTGLAVEYLRDRMTDGECSEVVTIQMATEF